jgi:uncharacterized OsmC-like protein
VNPFVWTVRVRADLQRAVTVHARNHAFPVGDSLSFRPTDEHPSALELLLGALASDLTSTFTALARKRRLPLDTLEVALTCTLHNPLISLGVIGEEGDPGIARIEGAFYVSSDAEEEKLQELWEETQQRAPLYNTLANATELAVRLRLTG